MNKIRGTESPNPLERTEQERHVPPEHNKFDYFKEMSIDFYDKSVILLLSTKEKANVRVSIHGCYMAD